MPIPSFDEIFVIMEITSALSSYMEFAFAMVQTQLRCLEGETTLLSAVFKKQLPFVDVNGVYISHFQNNNRKFCIVMETFK